MYMFLDYYHYNTERKFRQDKIHKICLDKFYKQNYNKIIQA
ncbi:hypothetical protein CHK_0989 [Christensenella hongkongensis]|uniref:Uncharacterized protein n=1 Tax=Christensenella hongkongensis TaxID=270498 RepID=A0A0M2NM62_9FIRM|nr:hypothetical protein CHK_0989 [Christensenella hongkongensis]